MVRLLIEVMVMQHRLPYNIGSMYMQIGGSYELSSNDYKNQEFLSECKMVAEGSCKNKNKNA